MKHFTHDLLFGREDYLASELELTRRAKSNPSHYTVVKEKYRLLPSYWKAMLRSMDDIDFHEAFHSCTKFIADREQSTPQWCDVYEMTLLFLERDTRNTETGFKFPDVRSFQMDHVIPTKGSIVCGLNVPDNLQLLSRFHNKIKLNVFPWDWNIQNILVSRFEEEQSQAAYTVKVHIEQAISDADLRQIFRDRQKLKSNR